MGAVLSRPVLSVANMATTQQLILDIQRGNQQAREELFRRFAVRVLFLVRARMGPKLRLKDGSSDLAQDALRRSLAALDHFQYASDGAFMAFLATKVEQAIQDRVDHWRAQRRNPEREVPLEVGHSSESVVPLSPMVDQNAPRPDQIVERREELDRLALALDRLREENEEYWEVTLAVFVEGRTFAEIAERMGSSADALKQKSYRAKRALAQIYGNLEKLQKSPPTGSK